VLSLAFSLSWLVLALNGRAFFLLSLFHSLGFQFRVENVASFIGIWLCGITVDWSLLLFSSGSQDSSSSTANSHFSRFLAFGSLRVGIDCCSFWILVSRFVYWFLVGFLLFFSSPCARSHLWGLFGFWVLMIMS